MPAMLRALSAALVLTLLFAPRPSAAQDLAPIQLPPAKTEGGRPLMDVLKARESARLFAPDPLPGRRCRTCCGPRSASTGSTDAAPLPRPATGGNRHLRGHGGRAFLYDAKAHALKPVAPGDHRAKTGTQAYVATAPVNLVYVADLAKTGQSPAEERDLFTPADAGFVAENAYLYCASEGLAVVVRGLIDRASLAKALNLRADQKIILAQTVGLPKK